MGIKTEEMLENLPPKEITYGVDWLGILESFDPSILDDKYINECARRNTHYTEYQWETPLSPVGDRISSMNRHYESAREDLERYVQRIQVEELTPALYKGTRQLLIAGIGVKGSKEYLLREQKRLGPEGEKRQKEAYVEWKESLKRKSKEADAEEEEEYVEDNWRDFHEKIRMVRRGVLDSNGKPLVQRDFARYLEYSVTKYAQAEKMSFWYGEIATPVEDELLEKLILRCHANPYWLYDKVAPADFAVYDTKESFRRMGYALPVFVTADVLLRWISEGKPRNTTWTDGIIQAE